MARSDIRQSIAAAPARITRLALTAALLALAACSTPVAQRPQPVIRGDVAAVRLDPAAARDMLTRYRASRGLAAVRLDPTLGALAQKQADAMAARGVLSHDVAGSFASRLDGAHVDTVSAAENIAAGYFSLGSAFESWQTSPPHDRNLLLPKVTRFGIALAKAPDTRYKTYWAMVVASDPPPPTPTLPTGPLVRRRVVQTDLGASVGGALAAPFNALFGR
ncbi:CAP domain-containing protein [Labrys wisconsinensis]|uniref:Uncharacterized protein YkwD n=1 Tax=Labrys wisconsinensis TaxID=425677 RepID=A0ABU0IZQ6_9HYPH|nr:CAP domain-containing protein [Labrys wisconsinensis]MDQ0467499.1 uncharacterized protein YkwD [Labrys wisconsinensis]